MFWNIAIAVVLAFLAALVSGLAGHLAATKTWHKWLFWGSGAVMIALIGIQTYRNETAQASLQAQLDKIQRNTEQPVTVNLPPPPAPKEHTRVNFVTPRPTQGDPLLPYRTGEIPSINLGFKNGGDFPIRDERMDVKIVVVPFSEYFTEFRKYRKELDFKAPTLGGVSNPHTDETNYHTYHGPVLTDDDVTKLNNAEKMLCAIAVLDWRDKSGHYQTDFLQCLVAERPFHQGVFNWHVGVENDAEHKLQQTL
jgi:hypothetical protein